MNSLNNLQTLSSRWNTLLNLEEEELLPPYLNPPMILLLWNCRGIHNRNFKIHLRDLIAYHKPAIIVPIETKAGGKEADRIMESFNYAKQHQSPLRWPSWRHLHFMNQPSGGAAGCHHPAGNLPLHKCTTPKLIFYSYSSLFETILKL